MSSICTSSCIEDARLPLPTTRVLRATYVNLYKWPESDAEFVRSVSFRGPGHPRPKVVESISCRQLYLRSYTFTRKKESVNEKTVKCFGKVKDKVVSKNGGTSSSSNSRSNTNTNTNTNTSSSNKSKKRSEKVKINNNYNNKSVKEVTCGAVKGFFRKLLFCSASVDVVDVNG